MQVFRTMLEEDVAAVAGPKGRHDPAGRVAYRHGDQESSVVLGGRKVAVSRPRVRGVADGQVEEECYYFVTGKVANFVVDVYRATSADRSKEAYDLFGSSNAHPVTGLGDEAKVGIEPDPNIASVVVRKGRLVLTVHMGGATPP